MCSRGYSSIFKWAKILRLYHWIFKKTLTVSPRYWLLYPQKQAWLHIKWIAYFRITLHCSQTMPSSRGQVLTSDTFSIFFSTWPRLDGCICEHWSVIRKLSITSGRNSSPIPLPRPVWHTKQLPTLLTEGRRVLIWTSFLNPLLNQVCSLYVNLP